MWLNNIVNKYHEYIINKGNLLKKAYKPYSYFQKKMRRWIIHHTQIIIYLNEKLFVKKINIIFFSVKNNNPLV